MKRKKKKNIKKRGRIVDIIIKKRNKIKKN